MAKPLPTPFSDELLLANLEKWRHLTHAEAAAIAAQDWDALRRHQDEKAALRLRFESVISSPTDTPATNEAARQLASELYTLEHANRAQLAIEIRKVKDQLTGDDRSLHTLGQVRKAYASTNQSSWETYS
ncbi:MAG: hypothetical protein EXS29_00665 [Pedosphaera sp.]|nr:hypothetical protein [Pedosphaera sp.]MSS99812.1 hypothetical protein [Pedosphaera sp.]